MKKTRKKNLMNICLMALAMALLLISPSFADGEEGKEKPSTQTNEPTPKDKLVITEGAAEDEKPSIDEVLNPKLEEKPKEVTKQAKTTEKTKSPVEDSSPKDDKAKKKPEADTTRSRSANIEDSPSYEDEEDALGASYSYDVSIGDEASLTNNEPASVIKEEKEKKEYLEKQKKEILALEVRPNDDKKETPSFKKERKSYNQPQKNRTASYFITLAFLIVVGIGYVVYKIIKKKKIN